MALNFKIKEKHIRFYKTFGKSFITSKRNILMALYLMITPAKLIMQHFKHRGDLRHARENNNWYIMQQFKTYRLL
jgi:hypothetical protein